MRQLASPWWFRSQWSCSTYCARACRKCRSPIGIKRSRPSSVIDRTKRSAYAFALGARSGSGYDAGSRVPELMPHVAAPLPISIADHDMDGLPRAVLGHRQRSHDLLHEQRLGAPQCALENVCHDVGRCGTGGRPAAFRIRPNRRVPCLRRPARCSFHDTRLRISCVNRETWTRSSNATRTRGADPERASSHPRSSGRREDHGSSQTQGRILHLDHRRVDGKPARCRDNDSLAAEIPQHRNVPRAAIALRESVYRRYAIADDRDLRVAVDRLDAIAAS